MISVDIRWLKSMKNARHILAVTLVAVAICADRVSAATPVDPASTPIATRIIQRLTVSFRRVLPTNGFCIPLRLTLGRAIDARPKVRDFAAVAPRRVGPFEFRLPPPLAS
jgi:hypothetical protein